jgi:small nuclear ribonucleoprotein (snRNP)-like protein
MFTRVLLLFFALAFTGHLYSQVSEKSIGELIQVTMINGDRYTGQVQSVDSLRIVLTSTYHGSITIPRSDITRVKYISGSTAESDEYALKNPNVSRHFFSPSAIPIPKGEGYYQNFYVAYNQVNYGLSDNFSLGVAGVPFAWFVENGFNLLLIFCSLRV